MDQHQYILFLILLSGTVPSLAAMQEQPGYPWYQSYKNPVIRQKVSEGWQKAKERASQSWQRTKKLAKENKRAIALAVGLMGAVYYMGKQKISSIHTKIAYEYSVEGLDLTLIKREYGLASYLDLVRLGLSAYSHRFDSIESKSAFINQALPKSRIYKRFKEEYDKSKKEKKCEFLPYDQTIYAQQKSRAKFNCPTYGTYMGQIAIPGEIRRLENALWQIMVPSF